MEAAALQRNGLFFNQASSYSSVVLFLVDFFGFTTKLGFRLPYLSFVSVYCEIRNSTSLE